MLVREPEPKSSLKPLLNIGLSLLKPKHGSKYGSKNFLFVGSVPIFEMLCKAPNSTY